jgi:uncharacterized protein YprB with RNaseH-like and TPR domain
MINNSFVLLDRIGYKTEGKIWKQNLLCWDDFINCSSIRGINKRQKLAHDKELEYAQNHLNNENPRYFSKKLKPRDYWRVYPNFKEKACFLDIETTGLNSQSDITVVGVYDGRNVKTFVKDINLSEEAIREEFSKYSILLTFYGSAFDIPFILRKYPGLKIDILHIDLCFTSRRIGLRGGLKSIERGLGIARDKEVAEIDGFEAVRLWRRWERHGEREAFERLVEYNSADVINLRALADIVYEKLWEKTFKAGEV